MSLNAAVPNTRGKPRVAIVEPVGAKGGMQFYDLGLGQALARAGVEVSLYSCKLGTERQSSGLRVWGTFDHVWAVPLPLRAVRYANASLNALSHARRSGCVLVHYHFFGAGLREAFMVGAAHWQRLKVVLTAHDVTHLAAHKYDWLAQRIFSAADAIIVHNQVSHEEIERLITPRSARVHVIPHGNYLPYIATIPSRAKARARLGLVANVPILLFFGQIKRVKGLDLLLRALPAILRLRPDVRIVIAGRMWKDNFARYQALINELAIGAQVDCRLGYIPDHEVTDYLAASDLTVLPYRRIYQSGVLLLAMSHACPVLVSDIPGMTEIVHHGSNGWVFRSNDASDLARQVLEILACGEQIAAVGEAGQEFVRKHHDWAEIARRTAAVYRAI